MRAFFYSLQATQPNFAAVRAGVRIWGDFHNLSWENFSIQAEQRAAQLYSNCYPLRLVEMALMNANPWIRMFYQILQRLFLSPKIKQVISLPTNRKAYIKASQVPSYALPVEWVGEQPRSAMLQTMGTNLRERYENAANFQLWNNFSYQNTVELQ